MIVGAVCRSLQTFLGYVCPAYYTYKTIESKKTEAMLEWAMYWFVLALFSTAERFMDLFLFWMPFYSIAKVLLVVYLWYPGTHGARVVYNKFVKRNLARYEPKIDEAVREARMWALDKYKKLVGDTVEVLKSHGSGVLARVQSISKKSKVAVAEPTIDEKKKG